MVAYTEWLKHNSNSYGDAVTDHFHTNNDAAISKLEDTVRELETRHEILIAKLSNPTEQMMLAGALAHNEGLRPLRAAVTASEAKKIFMAMIAVLKESMV
jgi:RNA-binding protein YlmH